MRTGRGIGDARCRKGDKVLVLATKWARARGGFRTRARAGDWWCGVPRDEFAFDAMTLAPRVTPRRRHSPLEQTVSPDNGPAVTGATVGALGRIEILARAGPRPPSRQGGRPTICASSGPGRGAAPVEDFTKIRPLDRATFAARRQLSAEFCRGCWPPKVGVRGGGRLRCFKLSTTVMPFSCRRASPRRRSATHPALRQNI